VELNLYLPAAMLVLGAYWFRYSCRVMLALAEHERRSATALAERNRLSFPAFVDTRDLDSLATTHARRMLDRDFRHLMYLAQCEEARLSILERSLVALDYRLMAACVRASRRFARPVARYALREMLGLLLYLTNTMGRRLGFDPCRRSIV
jgi:hypothetical protein